MTQRCYKLIGRVCGEGDAATSRVFNRVTKRAKFVQRQKANNGLTIGRRPQFRLLAKYIHKIVRTETDRARNDWLLLMIKY